MFGIEEKKATKIGEENISGNPKMRISNPRYSFETQRLQNCRKRPWVMSIRKGDNEHSSKMSKTQNGVVMEVDLGGGS